MSDVTPILLLGAGRMGGARAMELRYGNKRYTRAGISSH